MGKQRESDLGFSGLGSCYQNIRGRRKADEEDDYENDMERNLQKISESTRMSC